MIAKSELLRKFHNIIVSEGYAMPLYIGHLLQTLPWYGLPSDLEGKIRNVLEKMRLETEETRANTELVYSAIQESSHEMF